MGRVKLVFTLPFQIVIFWKRCLESPTMPALDRIVKITCEKCGNSVTKRNLARHNLHCSGGRLYCQKCSIFFSKSRDKLTYPFVRKRCAVGPKNNHTGKYCSTKFASFYSLRHHKHCFLTGETTSSGEEADRQSLADAGDDKSFEEELQSCRHLLVDSDIQKGRHSLFNFFVNKLTVKVIEEQLDRLLDKLKCPGKLNLALGFILKNIEDRKFRYF